MPLGTVHSHTGLHLWFPQCCSLGPRKQKTQEDQEHEEHKGLFHFDNMKTPADLRHVFNSKITISIGNKTRVAPRISKSVPEGTMELLSDVYRKFFEVGGGPGQHRTVNYYRHPVPPCLRPLFTFMAAQHATGTSLGTNGAGNMFMLNLLTMLMYTEETWAVRISTTTNSK